MAEENSERGNYTKNANKKFGDATTEISEQGDGVTSWNLAYSRFVGISER